MLVLAEIAEAGDAHGIAVHEKPEILGLVRDDLTGEQFLLRERSRLNGRKIVTKFIYHELLGLPLGIDQDIEQRLALGRRRKEAGQRGDLPSRGDIMADASLDPLLGLLACLGIRLQRFGRGDDLLLPRNMDAQLAERMTRGRLPETKPLREREISGRLRQSRDQHLVDG